MAVCVTLFDFIDASRPLTITTEYLAMAAVSICFALYVLAYLDPDA
jgi:hypothetical protein